MRSALIVGCIALVLMGTPSIAHARRGGGRGRSAGKFASAMWKMGMAQMQAMAAQQQYAAAQQAEAKRKHVSTYSSLRDKELAQIEARRQARLAAQGK